MTVQRVIRNILKHTWRAIVNKIREKRYNTQMETTQDNEVVDQASIVFRYVKDKEIHKQLFAVQPVQVPAARV
jgi:hypothetical protein